MEVGFPDQVLVQIPKLWMPRRTPKRYVLGSPHMSFPCMSSGVTPYEIFDGANEIGAKLSPNVKSANIRPKNIVEAINFIGKEF